MQQQAKWRQEDRLDPEVARVKKRQRIEEKKDLELLTMSEVFNLLTNLGMSIPMQTIQQFHIDGDLLACCASHSDLTELGVTVPNAKLTLLVKKIAKFVSEGVPVDLITTHTVEGVAAIPVARKELPVVPGVVIATKGSPVSTLSQDSVDVEVNTVQETLADTRLSQNNARKRVKVNPQTANTGTDTANGKVQVSNATLLPTVHRPRQVNDKNQQQTKVAASHPTKVPIMMEIPSADPPTIETEMVKTEQCNKKAVIATAQPTVAAPVVAEPPLAEYVEQRRYDHGDAYTGSLVSGKRQGLGVMTYADGCEYEGEWVNDERHGEGVLTFDKQEGKCRRRYQGQWEHNKYWGSGRLNFESGSQYSGQFKDGQILGYGLMVYANGDSYEGFYGEGARREGEFHCRYSSGSRYHGPYKNNRKEGMGEYVSECGDVYKGSFERGVLTGTGTVLLADGKSYNGNLVNRDFEGWGRLVDPKNGFEYYGDFVGGQREGKGVLRQSNGVQYSGEWRADKRHGQGVMSNENGVIYEGLFVNDRYHRNEDFKGVVSQSPRSISGSGGSYPVVYNQFL